MLKIDRVVCTSIYKLWTVMSKLNDCRGCMYEESLKGERTSTFLCKDLDIWLRRYLVVVLNVV